MKNSASGKVGKKFKNLHFWVLLCAVLIALLFFLVPEFFSSAVTYKKGEELEKILENAKELFVPKYPPLDTLAYDRKIEELANNPPPPPPKTQTVVDPETGIQTVVILPPPVTPPPLWPVETVYPKDGAILPFKRVIAYYGNLYSTKMGALGEYPEEEMLARLDAEVKKWEDADPATPVQPALHYIAVTAQQSPGESGKYRLRMPDSEIDKVLKMAEKIDAIVFLDLQVGFSTLAQELPRLEKYFQLSNVHLGIDPEFSMKGTIRPGKVVGTYDAADINFAIEFLARIVRENDLSPKILVVHRYTQRMVTNYKQITPLPEVQIVMHMDGWGGKAKKKNTYEQFVYKEPVQFAGFKIFYKNDIWEPGTVLFTPEELLKLRPVPVYIQYQ